MSIFPLPQFEADLEADRKVYEALQPPKTIVVRFGAMRMLGEYPYDGTAKPGCGSKLVARTHRGTELVEMLTTTCPNSGCGKSVSRGEMLQFFENSGGRDYPFHTDGRILRVATVDDLNHMSALEAKKHQWIVTAREVQAKVGPGNIKIVDAEPILGGERLLIHFLSEERVDFRALVMELAHALQTRVEMHQVGARDEARITADYERCGQHCCCRQFLKVLKPVSMKSAKTQKATLDPLKISGRCGRLMCCLRYEDTTYDELKKNLPKKKTPIMTPDGPGIVIDTQILTQLVLVRLDATNEDAAYPIENLTPAGSAPAAKPGTPGVDDDEQTPGEGPLSGPPVGGPVGGPGGPSGGARPEGRQGGGGGGGPRRDGRDQQGRGGGGGGGGGQRDQGGGRGGRPDGRQGSGGQREQGGGQRPAQGREQNRDGGRDQGRGGQPGQGPNQGHGPQGQSQGPNQGQNQGQNPGQGGGGGGNRRPLTDEEREKKRMQKLIPRSEFRGDDLHRPIDRSQPPADGPGPGAPGPSSGTDAPPAADQ